MSGSAPAVWYSAPGGTSANEDAVSIASGTVVVVDGGTARTDTGCVHGVAWYARHLADHIGAAAEDRNRSLSDVLAEAIDAVAKLHPACDLSHPGTPAAAVGIARRGSGSRVQYLVLADVYLILERRRGDIEVVTDRRVSQAAAAERAEGRRWPIGSAEQLAALRRMKRAELAGRGVSYWVAAADPAAAAHALTGELGEVVRFALLSDGAARAQTFGLLDWRQVLDVLGGDDGPRQLVDLVRQAEDTDPAGQRWPRNKRSDDATAVYAPAP